MHSIMLHRIFLIKHILIARFVLGESTLPSLERLPIKLKEVVAGDSVVFPCQTTYSINNDYILLILIYKDNTKYPIISFDRRSSDPQKYKLWSENHYSRRISIRENRKRVNVILSDVWLSDQNVYRCSVVYKNLPTKITKFQLKIIERVESVFITAEVDGEGDKSTGKEVVGPFEPGTNLTLSCHVIGGNPVPNASWWNERLLIDNTTELQFNNTVVNILKLSPLAKEDHFRRFTCQGINSNLVKPLSVNIIVELKLPPSSVKITLDVPFLEPNRGPKIASISEKQPIQLYCRVLETNLTVDIVWKKNSEILDNNIEKYSVSEKGANIQSSSIVLTPDFLDNGSIVRCIAFNTKFPEKNTDDSLLLNVLFVPKVRLLLRGTSTPDVEPGEDLYLACQVASNPPVSTFNWRIDGQAIVSNVSSGVVITASGDSLIIHDVSSLWSGQYSCSAENGKGVGHSDLLDIKVIAPSVPKCTNQSQTVTAAANTTIDLYCEVDAYPPVTSFKWSFLDSAEHVQSTPASKRTSKAKLKYDIRRPSDFQTLLCQAENLIGETREPCIFTIAPKGAKNVFKDCRITNISAEKIEIKCDLVDMKSSRGIGLFHLSVSTLDVNDNLEWVLSVKSPTPHFLIREVLIPGHVYIFKISSEKIIGYSESTKYLTFKAPRKKISSKREFAAIEISSSPTQLAAIILGIFFTLLTSFILVCCLRRKNRTKMLCEHSQDDHEFIYVQKIKENNLLVQETKEKNDEDFNNLNHQRRFMTSGRLIIGVRNETKYQISNLDTLMDLRSKLYPQKPTTTEKSHSARNEAFQNTTSFLEANFENSFNSQNPPFISQRNSNSLNSLSTNNSSSASDANMSPTLGGSTITVVLNPLYRPAS